MSYFCGMRDKSKYAEQPTEALLRLLEQSDAHNLALSEALRQTAEQLKVSEKERRALLQANAELTKEASDPPELDGEV